MFSPTSAPVDARKRLGRNGTSAPKGRVVDPPHPPAPPPPRHCLRVSADTPLTALRGARHAPPSGPWNDMVCVCVCA